MKARDITIRKVEAALYASKETEKMVDDLTVELIATKDSLYMANDTHQEAKEHRLVASMAKEREAEDRDKEINIPNEELEWLQQHLSFAKILNQSLELQSLCCRASKWNLLLMRKVNQN